MAKKKQQTTGIPKTLLLICVISGLSMLVLRILNRRLNIPEIWEIAGYAGTAFVISVIIIAGIFIVDLVNKN